MGMFDDYRFHCSSIGAIMTDPRSGKGLSETCKAHLLECYISKKYGRWRETENKYIEKGNMVEEDSITLYSAVSKKMFVKNTAIFENQYIIGTPDIITSQSVIDIKSSWNIHTFFQNIHKPLNKDYVWQLNGYCDLITVPQMRLVYVLVNTPPVIVEQEKSRLRYKMGLIDPDASELYQHACELIDKNSFFDDIPMKERYMEFEIPRMDMVLVYDRVKECRNFLNALP
jgi:hypothetical protein